MARVLNSQKSTGIFGIISQILLLTAFLIVVTNSSWFSWTENNLSILGEQGSLKNFFNWGLITSGIFYLIFTLGLYRNTLVDKAGGYGLRCLIGSSLALIATGIFPRTIEVPHDFFSVGFFTLVIAFFLLSGVSMLMASKTIHGTSSITAGLITVALLWIPWTWEGEAIPQFLACIPWSLWTIRMSVKLLSNTGQINLRKEI